MKRHFSFLLCCLLFAFFVSCNGGSNQNNDNTLMKIQNTNEVNVGYIIFEPTIMENPSTGELEGVFIDMFEEIVKSINPNVKINYHQTTLSTFHTELNSNKIDICIGATFATPKRASVVAFTHPLFYCGYTGVAKKEDADKYDSWDKIDNPNVRLGVLQGSAIADLVSKDFSHQDNVISFTGADVTIPLAAVSSDQADVGLMNQITVFTYLREHPELVEVMSNEPLATTYFSWAVKQNDLQWLNFLNTSIDYMQNAGTMYRFEKKYNVPLMHQESDFFFPLLEQ